MDKLVLPTAGALETESVSTPYALRAIFDTESETNPDVLKAIPQYDQDSVEFEFRSAWPQPGPGRNEMPKHKKALLEGRHKAYIGKLRAEGSLKKA
jgi:hypothetical protein